MSRIRLGFIGCGEVTQLMHLPSLLRLTDRFTVAALCDVSAKVVNGVGDRFNVAARFVDYHDLLAQPEIDAVVIALPHAYHAEVTLEALAAGKHVFVEKPMCFTLREADAVAAAQARTGLTVQVGYNRRYGAAFNMVKALLSEMGEIRTARVHDVIGRNMYIAGQVGSVIRGDDLPEDLLAEPGQIQDRLTVEALGNVPDEVKAAYSLLLSLNSHDLSAMRELFGMPRKVLYASRRQIGRFIYMTAAFDYGSYVCQFETGVDQIPRFDQFIEAFGLDRVVRLRHDTPFVRHAPNWVTLLEAEGDTGWSERTVQPDWGDSFLAEWAAFHTNVTEHRMPKTSPSDFRQDLELMQEMIRLMQLT